MNNIDAKLCTQAKQPCHLESYQISQSTCISTPGYSYESHMKCTYDNVVESLDMVMCMHADSTRLG